MNRRRLVAGTAIAGMQLMLFDPCYANGLPVAQTAPISPHNATVQSHTVTGGITQAHSNPTPAPLHGSTSTVAPATSHWVPMPSHAAATVSTSSSTITVQGHTPAVNHWTPPNVPAANSSSQPGVTHIPPVVTVTSPTAVGHSWTAAPTGWTPPAHNSNIWTMPPATPSATHTAPAITQTVLPTTTHSVLPAPTNPVLPATPSASHTPAITQTVPPATTPAVHNLASQTTTPPSSTQNNTTVVPSTHIWANTAGASSQSINIDLGSSSQNLTASSLLHNSTATITVGGHSMTVTGSTKLTAAEFLAVNQVLNGGTQSLLIDSHGVASSGTVIINQPIGQHVSSLIVPQGVTVIDLTNSGTLNLAGNVSVGGSLYLSSFNHSLSSIGLSASNITVQPHGLISDAIPLSLMPLLKGTDSLLNLNLNAFNNISNSGSIISSGSLSLNAGGSIINALPAGTSAATPVMQAAQSLNLVTGSGIITNSGLMTALTGSINISASKPTTDITINGSAGTFQALAGAINVRDAAYSGSANLNLNGSNFLSNNLNLYSGTGAINGVIGQISGNLNSHAAVEHLIADTANLKLGNNTITGDPTFVSTGNIIISGSNTFTEDLAIIAQGNITSTATGAIVDIGNNVTLIAGAVVGTLGSVNGPGTTTIPTTALNINGATGTGNGTGGTTATADLANPVTGGGNIDFTSSGAGTVITTVGGNVSLLAVSKNAGTGNIWFQTGTTSVDTSNTVGAGGNVLVIAGGTGGAITQAIQLGSVVTGGNPGGSFQAFAAQPQVSGGGVATFTDKGTTANTFIPTGGFASPTLTAGATMSIGQVNTSGTGGNGGAPAAAGAAGGSAGLINISSSGAIQTGSLLAFGGGGGGAGGITQGGAGGSGAAITVQSSKSNITVNGDVDNSGGGGGGTVGAGLAGIGGSAGSNLTLAAAGSVNVSGVVLSANGGDGAVPGGGSFGGAGGGAGIAAPGGSGYFGGGGGGLAGGPGGGGGGGGYAGSGGGGGGLSGPLFSPGGAGGGGGNGSAGVLSGGSGVGGVGAGGGGRGGSVLAGDSNGGNGGTGNGLGGAGGGIPASGGSSSNPTAPGFAFGAGAIPAGSGSGNGGAIQLTGSSVVVGSTIGSGPFGPPPPPPPPAPPAQSISALGNGGTVTITTTAGGFTVAGAGSAGSIAAGTPASTNNVTVNGIVNSFLVSSGTFGGGGGGGGGGIVVGGGGGGGGGGSTTNLISSNSLGKTLIINGLSITGFYASLSTPSIVATTISIDTSGTLGNGQTVTVNGRLSLGGTTGQSGQLSSGKGTGTDDKIIEDVAQAVFNIRTANLNGFEGLQNASDLLSKAVGGQNDLFNQRTGKGLIADIVNRILNGTGNAEDAMKETRTALRDLFARPNILASRIVNAYLDPQRGVLNYLALKVKNTEERAEWQKKIDAFENQNSQKITSYMNSSDPNTKQAGFDLNDQLIDLKKGMPPVENLEQTGAISHEAVLSILGQQADGTPLQTSLTAALLNATMDYSNGIATPASVELKPWLIAQLTAALNSGTTGGGSGSVSSQANGATPSSSASQSASTQQTAGVTPGGAGSSLATNATPTYSQLELDSNLVQVDKKETGITYAPQPNYKLNTRGQGEPMAHTHFVQNNNDGSESWLPDSGYKFAFDGQGGVALVSDPGGIQQGDINGGPRISADYVIPPPQNDVRASTSIKITNISGAP